MEFDKSRAYTAVNADELKVGSKVFVADTLDGLKYAVTSNNFEPVSLEAVNTESCQYRFVSGGTFYSLAYLVEAPAKLKWTDLKVGDIIQNGKLTSMVTSIEPEPELDELHIYAGDTWYSDEELKEWRKVE